MSNLYARYAALKARVSGNREISGFEYTIGRTPGERARITPPERHIVRVLSEIQYAIPLSQAHGGAFDTAIDAALKRLEDEMDRAGALGRGACAEAERELLPLSEAAREYEIIFAGHAHIDMNWMWGWQETVAVTLATFRTVLNLMREYPDFTFSQSQASVYSIVEEHDPEMMEEIRSRIAEGRWEVTASAWVETDKNMPDTESLIRHIRETRDYLQSHWGVDPESVKVDFSPDTFGHSAFVPEISAFGSVKYYYHCRGVRNEMVLYRYRAPSGSEVLAYKEPYWYNSGVTPDCAAGLFELSRRCAGLKTGLIVYGVGDHGGGVTRRDVERVLEMREWPVFPRLRFGTIHQFFRAAEAVWDKVPILDREANAIFAGCYTTQSRIKLGNRRCEAALLDAEKLSALATGALGVRYPGEALHGAWRKVLFTHFHDILTGSCVQDSREYAMGLYAGAMAHAQTESAKAMKAISEALDTTPFASGEAEDIRFTLSEGAGGGYGLASYAGVPNPERGAGKTRVYTVFNPASAARRGPVELTVWDYPGDLRRLEAVDHLGRPARLQLLDAELREYWGHCYARALLDADVPALGYAAYALQEKPAESYSPFYSLLSETERVESPRGHVTLENDFLRAAFDGHTGALVSLIDKPTGKEMLSAPAGLVLTMITADGMSAWRIGRYLKSAPVDDMVSFTELPAGELRRGFTAEYRVLDSTVKATVTLDDNARTLCCAFEVDWREYARPNEPRPLLRYAVPCAGAPRRVLMDVPAGAVVRDAKHMDMPALSYAAAVGETPAPAIVSDCKYGFRLADGELSCTLINTADNPDKYPERGIHSIRLWIGPAQEDARAMKQLSETLNHPMTGVPTAIHPGSLEPRGALMEFSADSAVLSSVALSGDGALDVRVFETCGRDSDVRIVVPFDVRSAALVDLNGSPVGEAAFDGREVRFRVRAWKLAQVRIRG